MSSLPLRDADPEGDLVLLVGPEETAIRVSSKVLSLASPVFVAMLGPNFAEGKPLSERDSRGWTVSLPDDNLAAMELLCQALHYKLKFSAIISFELINSMAVLCDKYDMSLALGVWSETWMQNREESVDNGYIPEILWISYAFNNHHLFWETSRDMIVYYTTQGLATLCSGADANGILPDGVFGTDVVFFELESVLIVSLSGSIIAEREGALLQMQTTIEDIISPQLKAVCPKQQQHDVNHTPYEYLLRTDHYLKQLSGLGLWPISRMFHQTNLSDISSQLLEFRNYAVDDVNRNTVFRSSSCHHFVTDCQSMQTDFRNILQTAANAVSTQQQGLCLKCIKSGKITKEDGNCRAATEALHDSQATQVNIGW